MKLIKEILFFLRVVLNLHEQPQRKDHIGPAADKIRRVK